MTYQITMDAFEPHKQLFWVEGLNLSVAGTRVLLEAFLEPEDATPLVSLDSDVSGITLAPTVAGPLTTAAIAQGRIEIREASLRSLTLITTDDGGFDDQVELTGTGSNGTYDLIDVHPLEATSLERAGVALEVRGALVDEVVAGSVSITRPTGFVVEFTRAQVDLLYAQTESVCYRVKVFQSGEEDTLFRGNICVEDAT